MARNLKKFRQSEPSRIPTRFSPYQGSFYRLSATVQTTPALLPALFHEPLPYRHDPRRQFSLILQ